MLTPKQKNWIASFTEGKKLYGAVANAMRTEKITGKQATEIFAYYNKINKKPRKTIMQKAREAGLI